MSLNQMKTKQNRTNQVTQDNSSN